MDLIFSPWPGNRQTLNLSEWIGMDRNGSEWIGMDRNGWEWIGMDGNGSECRTAFPPLDKSHTQILNSMNVCYIPFERAKRALSNATYSFVKHELKGSVEV